MLQDLINNQYFQVFAGIGLAAVVILVAVENIRWEWEANTLRYPGLRRDLQTALSLSTEQIEGLPTFQLARYTRATNTARNLRQGALQDDPELTKAFRQLDAEKWRRNAIAVKAREAAAVNQELESMTRIEQRKRNDAAAIRAQLGMKQPDRHSSDLRGR